MTSIEGGGGGPPVARTAWGKDSIEAMSLPTITACVGSTSILADLGVKETGTVNK